MADENEVMRALTGGIVFKKQSQPNAERAGKVKTKARKKAYTTGQHGSGAAKKKAEIRLRRATRHRS